MSQFKLPREQEKPDITATLDALTQGEERAVPATVFYGLSGLSAEDIAQVEPVWESLSTDYRRKVMRRLVDTGEANVEMDYGAFGRFALGDPDPGVRGAAIELLFEDLSIGLMQQLMEVAQWDESTDVRAAAASALGRFIYAGEVEDLPLADTLRAQDVVVGILTNEDEDVAVRRRALEAISNCSHEIVPEAIEEAYNSGDRLMRVSALFAMGRSYDERWERTVLRELDSPDAELRYEAARAAGELELRDAVPRLVLLATGNDREIQETAIWSLGEIGGVEATRALNALASRAEEAGDAALSEAIDDALLSANLVDHELLDDGLLFGPGETDD